MNRILLGAALVCGGALGLTAITSGHGGMYLGPGDTVPPGGGGGGGGGGTPTGPGGSGGSTGGPSGPNVPKGPTGGPTGTGGPSRPGTPTGGGGSVEPVTWENWWGFNKNRYLNLKAAIYDGVSSGNEGFFLSDGQPTKPRSTYRPSEQAIRDIVVPALKHALEKERSNDLVTGCLIALGKIGDVKNGDDGSSEFEPIIRKFLADPSQEIAETAAVSLGILANDASVGTLVDLARDTPAARKLIATGSVEVPYRTRAFATYGLGLIGYRTARNEVRQEIARALVALLEAPDSATRDVKVAALISLGLVPIDVDRGQDLAARKEPDASRQAQIEYIQRILLDPQQHHLLRAQAPTAIARLLRPDSERSATTNAQREEMGRLFVSLLGETSKEKKEVQQSCVLALGMIGDASSSKVDTAIRETLVRVSDTFDQQSANFALIAMAQVGGRGRGDECVDGRRKAREFLVKSIDGKNHLRPWAGLAIGVLERELLDDGQAASEDTLAVLLSKFKDAGNPERVGAWSIGLGIARAPDAANLVAAKMRETSEATAKGYMCVSLGLLGARECAKELTEVVRDSKYKPELLRQAAIGAALLGEKELVNELIATLADAKATAGQASIASALGFIGDARSIDPLVKMLANKEVSDTARGFAAVALGIVSDKEMLPWNSKISANLNYRANMPTLTSENGTGILDIL